MRNEKNGLLQFLGGLAMLVAGLFILSQKVMVTSGFFGGGLVFGGFHVNNGLVMVPLIIGIIWMFASGGKIASKIFTVGAVLLILAAIIMNTNLYLARTTLYEWVLILVLIFGGAGLLAKVLFADRRPTRDDQPARYDRLEDSRRQAEEIEREIERMKRK